MEPVDKVGKVGKVGKTFDTDASVFVALRRRCDGD